jgi:Zn-dependent M32 family carboxypeptidase
MAEDDARLYRQACDHNRQTALLGSIQAVLEWDERTMLPSSAAEYRAEQIVLLSGLGHQRQTDPLYGEWLGRLAASRLATRGRRSGSCGGSTIGP